MLITRLSERNRRTWQKGLDTLEFLSFHRYSTLSVITKSLGFKSKSTASSVLKHLCSESYISRAVVKDEVSRIVLFGITKKGLLEFELKEKTPFLKGKVSLRTLAHKLAIQKTHICYRDKFKYKYETHFILPDYSKKQKRSDDFRADLKCIYWHGNEELESAFEVELTLKNKTRYFNIFKYYFSLRMTSNMMKVVYVTREETQQKRLTEIKNHFKEIITKDYYNKSLYPNQTEEAKEVEVKNAYERLFEIRTLNDIETEIEELNREE